MNKHESHRRQFLRRQLGGAAFLAAAGGIAAAGSDRDPKPPQSKKAVYRPNEKPSPSAIFSPGIRFGNLVFISGQGAHDPTTHKVVEGPFQDQVRRCLENVKIVLESAGSSLDRALKCTVFLKDIENYGPMNEVYHTFFTKEPPARSTVVVKDLPGNSPVEIECIAYVD